MSRLHHDVGAYIATLRMTRYALVVWIEGKENDPIFYSRVVERYELERGVSVQLRRSRELPGSATAAKGGSGGKSWLFRAGHFWSRFKAVRNPIVSCSLLLAVDKDIDDIIKIRAPSVKIVYTEGYSVEQYLIDGSSLEAITQAALSLLPRESSVLDLKDQPRWMGEKVLLWIDWVVYCLLARAYYKTKLHGYSSGSKFNKPKHAATDTAVAQDRYELLRSKASIPKPEFEAVRDQAHKFVMSCIASGVPGKVFKAEWFIEILYSQVESEPSLAGNYVQAGLHGLWSAIRATYVVPEGAYQHYRKAFDTARLTKS